MFFNTLIYYGSNSFYHFIFWPIGTSSNEDSSPIDQDTICTNSLVFTHSKMIIFWKSISRHQTIWTSNNRTRNDSLSNQGWNIPSLLLNTNYIMKWGRQVKSEPSPQGKYDLETIVTLFVLPIFTLPTIIR